MMFAQSQKRKRYVVTIKGNGIEEHTVIIASSPEEMRGMLEKLFSHVIFDNIGIPRGEVTYVESELL